MTGSAAVLPVWRLSGDNRARSPTPRSDPFGGVHCDDRPTTTAVVLIEHQNDFTTEGGVLHGAVKAVTNSTDMLNELGRHPYGILKGVVDGQCFIKGSWGGTIADRMAPEDGDIVVEGKRGLDTFASTNLDFILRSKITTIALGGFLTSCCVESPMSSGYENGYDVLTLTDCTAATSVEEHDNAITHDFPMSSHLTTSQAFVADLG